MQPTSRFALALTLAIGLCVAAIVLTIAKGGDENLPPEELLRVEQLPTDPASPLEDHLRYEFEIFAGTRRYTDAELVERWTPRLRGDLTAESLEAVFEETFAGQVFRFVRVSEQGPDSLAAIGVNQVGRPAQFMFRTDDNGRLDSLVIVGQPSSRLPGWGIGVILLAALGSLGAAVVAWRHRQIPTAWMLLAASIPASAAIGVLSDTSVVYTAGRTIPDLAVVAAAVLLIGSVSPGRRWLLVAAFASALAGALAVFVRDTALIGHPDVLLSFGDSDTIHRALLGVSGTLAAVAMGGIAAVSMTRIGLARGRVRPVLWATSVLAAFWCAASLGAAIDYGFGDGTLAAGPFRAVMWTGYAAVPALVIFRLIVTRWDGPELASLVIDLDGEGDLQPAIARALGDPSLELLTSPDGEVLVDSAGDVFETGDLPNERSLTRIRSSDRLVGGLVYDSANERDPSRLEAVAAATGMALQLSRLNQQVLAQLGEVDASRARILEASDIGRRRVERDLHDGAQQRLVALGLRLQRAGRLADLGARGELRTLLDEATKEVREAIDEIRAVSRGGQPALLAERGLAPAIDALAERAPVPVQLVVSGDQLPAAAERTAYFVISEGLTNVAKHANATCAEVSVSRRNGVASVTIRDDGIGGAEIASGSGLEGLKDRIAATGGTFDVSSGQGGTTLKATIPCG